MIQNHKRWTAVAVAVLALAGCGEKEIPLVPVSGRITLNNEPLQNARVLFTPTDSGTVGISSSALTDSGGNFDLKASDGRPGAVVGQHSVIVSPPVTVSSPASVPSTQIGSRPGDEIDLPDSARLMPVEDAPGGLTAPTEASFEVPEGGTQTALINVQGGR